MPQIRYLLSVSILIIAANLTAQKIPDTGNINNINPKQYLFHLQKAPALDLNRLVTSSSPVIYDKTIDDLSSMRNLSLWFKIDAVNVLEGGILLELYLPGKAKLEAYTSEILFERNKVPQIVQIELLKSRPNYYFAEIKDNVKSIFIHIETNQLSEFKVKKYSNHHYFEKERWLNVYYGFSIGIFILLMLYHTVLYFKVRDRAYLYYSIYAFFSSTIVLPNSAFLSVDTSIISHFSLMAFQLACIIFSSSYLNAHKKSQQWKTAIITTIFITLIINILEISISSPILHLIVNILSLIIYLWIIYLTTIHSKNELKPDWLFLFPWLVLFLSHLAYILKLEFIFEYYQTLEIGLIINICLLALAFGNKLNIYKDEKNLAESKEIRALLERDKIIHEQNTILELLINERHKEILKKNKKLSEQQQEIENQNKQIKLTNYQLEIINQELYNKNNEITTQNNELQKHHELLEIIVNKRTKRLKTARERAIVADQLKTSFLNNLTFEIHTPMNAIMGFAGLLTDKNITKEKRNEYLSIINKNVDILLESIDNVIILAKIQARVMKPRLIDFKLNDLFTKCIDFFSDKLKSTRNKNVTLNINNMGSENESNLYADYDKIWQIIYKLVDNSIKYTPQGEIRIEYSIERKSSEEKSNSILNIKVIDTGIGINKDKREFIFERFSSIEDDKTKLYHGAGIGLAIVKGLIDILNGNIKVNSEIDKGSVFEISIPVVVKK